MHYSIEIMTESGGQWVKGPLVFAEKAEAYGFVRELAQRWVAVKLFRCIETEEPVNYTWDQWVGLTRVAQSAKPVLPPDAPSEPRMKLEE